MIDFIKTELIFMLIQIELIFIWIFLGNVNGCMFYKMGKNIDAFQIISVYYRYYENVLSKVDTGVKVKTITRTFIYRHAKHL